MILWLNLFWLNENLGEIIGEFVVEVEVIGFDKEGKEKEEGFRCLLLVIIGLLLWFWFVLKF